jgi:hypothetical protein
MSRSEEELKALENRRCWQLRPRCVAGGINWSSLLSAVRSTSKSRIRYVRIMDLKEEVVQAVGFQRLPRSQRTRSRKWFIGQRSSTQPGLADALIKTMIHLEIDGLHVSQSVSHFAGILRQAAARVPAGK